MNVIRNTKQLLPLESKMPISTAKLDATQIVQTAAKRFGKGKGKTMRYMRGVAVLLDQQPNWKDGFTVDVTDCTTAEREWIKAMIIFYFGERPEQFQGFAGRYTYIRTYGYAC